jgi:hypothetical protein
MVSGHRDPKTIIRHAHHRQYTDQNAINFLTYDDDVTKQASRIHQESGLPGEFAVFLDLYLDDGEVRPVLYFSPVAAKLCAELILSFEGKACSLPTNPGPSFGMAYGNSEEAWALSEYA